MTLTTHAIIAAAVAKPLAHSHPVLIFLAALASHYLADAIPHWDYKLRSLAEDDDIAKKDVVFTRATFWLDLMRSALDALLGLGVVALLVWPASPQEWLFVLLTVVGGLLPDFLQGVYYGLRLNFLKPHQRFHDWIHARIRLGPYPRLGIPLQLVLVIAALIILV